eukprot:1181387-Prorocentrum_minimum.AAC.5
MLFVLLLVRFPVHEGAALGGNVGVSERDAIQGDVGGVGSRGRAARALAATIPKTTKGVQGQRGACEESTHLQNPKKNPKIRGFYVQSQIGRRAPIFESSSERSTGAAAGQGPASTRCAQIIQSVPNLMRHSGDRAVSKTDMES